MAELTREEIEQIQALYEKATKGPWYDAGCCTVHGGDPSNPEDHEEIAHPMNCDNVPFIVALVNAWPSLYQTLKKAGE